MSIELDIEELKQEATDLGIAFADNIGAKKLKERIDAYYESQETSGKEIQEAVEAKEKSEEKSAENGNVSRELLKKQKIAQAKIEANKTRVVRIIDNDQRVNNQTTTCKVTCANIHFDLGTVIVPLNLPVELKVGHIEVLKSIKIPQHFIVDRATGMSEVRHVPRFTVVYEDIKE